jgi:hypothetical protein
MTDHHDGERLLDAVRDSYAKFCIMPSMHALNGVTLWTVATHLVSEFHFAPRLVVRSAEKRSGKTRLVEVAAEMVPEKPLRIANATLAYVFRALAGDPPPTILFDEADTMFGNKKVAESNEDLRALFNAGFQRGTPIGRTVGPQHIPTEFETFAFAALAGIGRMPDTIEDRAVVVPMRRRKASEKVAPYRARRDGPDLNDTRAWIAEWADQVRDAIRHHEPTDLGVEDRAADVWESLVSVADMAGGHWPKTARTAAMALVTQAAEDDAADSTNVRLLSDIRDVFGALPGVSFLKSDAMCIKLQEITDAPWKQFDLNPSKLGRRLREYQIKTGRNAAGSERGYRLDDMLDAFDRYLPPPEIDPQGLISGGMPSEGVRSRQTGSDQGISSDIIGASDTMKASDDFKVSEQTARPEAPLTASDAFCRLPDVTTSPTPSAMPVRLSVDAPKPQRVSKQLCPSCERAKARDDSGLCDFCTARQQAVAEQLATLTTNGDNN